MAQSNRRFLLRERPAERCVPETFELVEEDIPDVGEGEALVRTECISLDPTNRAWIGETPTYLPPVGIGEVMRAAGLGRVIESKHPAYQEGQLVQGLIGWQEWMMASDSAPLLPVTEVDGVAPSLYLGALGMTGLTAWIGINDIGKPQEGETVVVSAAAGAVGSVAGQLAKAHGARAVGIAGGPEKCELLTEQLGFDAAVDYKAPDWRDQLKAATPNGIDVDFENVGGDDHGRGLRPPEPACAGGPLRADLRLQRHGAAGRAAQLREPAGQPGERSRASSCSTTSTARPRRSASWRASWPTAGSSRSRPWSRASRSCPPPSTCCSTARTSASSS